MKSLIATGLITLAVSLGMSANAYAQTDASAAMAASASGAPSKKDMRIANRQLAKSVRRALTKNGKIDVSHITVLAKSGAVSLDGSVVEEDQIAAAGQIAAGVSGVKSVANHLSVATPGH